MTEATIISQVERAKALLKEKQKELYEISAQKNDLTELQAMAETVREKEALVLKAIQSQAQKWIDRITTRKKELEKKVGASTGHEVLEMIQEHLVTFSKNEEMFSGPVERAIELLDESETDAMDQDYLEEITTVIGELEALQTPEVTRRDLADLWKKLDELCMTSQNFIPGASPDLGHIETTTKTNYISQMACNQIYEDSIPADENDMIIPCVAMLGKGLYAVAKPVQEGQLSKAINIYDLTGTLKHTLTDRVGGVYDMSHTEDNKLAVLSNTAKDQYCCVKIFDPDPDLINGYIKMVVRTKMSKPISLGVGLQDKYAIHGMNEEGKEQIIIFDKKGDTILKHTTDKSSQDNDRITVGGGLIFVKRLKTYLTVDIYKLQGKNLTLFRENWRYWFSGKMMDISATVRDELFITNLFRCKLELFGAGYDENIEVPNGEEAAKLHELPIPGCTTSRFSIRDNYIVLSMGLKVKVFKLD